MSTSLSCAGLLLSLCALAPFEVEKSAWTELAGCTPSQWRIVWQENPATSATFSWSTRDAGKEHAVHLGKTAEAGRLENYERRVECQRNGAYTTGDTSVNGAHYHHALVEGLEPSTTYYFVLESNKTSSKEMRFTTAPQDDRAFKLLYGGDSRTGIEARQVMNLMMAELAQEDPDVLAFAHGGDYIFNGRNWPMWSTWLSQQELSTTVDGRVLPIVPVRGNHDVGPLYDEIFDSPGGGGKNYYVTQLGQRVALITLNSEISTAGNQAVWLEDQLASLRLENRWLLAQFHRPVYPAVKQPGVAKASWVPLFEDFDLDLVLESDGHVAKRSVPIRDEKHDPTGVTYIGEGGLGVPQRVPDGERWYLKPPGMTARGHHVTILEFGDDVLRMRTVGPPLPQKGFQPLDYKSLIGQDASWRYLAGSDPDGEWTADDYNEASWKLGEAGFGFGDNDDASVLDGMRSEYARVYVRYSLPKSAFDDCTELALMIRYDDAFIAYFEGQEICRSGIKSGRGAAVSDVEPHEARVEFDYFPIPGWRDMIEGDEIVLSIEGHNASASSYDVTLHPFLIADPANQPKPGASNVRILDDHSLSVRDTLESF
ncbi:MAG: hypothetical protein ACI841_001214 [Planctomycetota bacterium]|jgi:hypothetical protein